MATWGDVWDTIGSGVNDIANAVTGSISDTISGSNTDVNAEKNKDETPAKDIYATGGNFFEANKTAIIWGGAALAVGTVLYFAIKK